jgi:hypothetical protein
MPTRNIFKNTRLAVRRATGGERRSLPTFLKESDIKLLVFVGKCMDFFGTRAVLGFVIGGSMVWGYALFEQLPYAGRFAKNPIAPAVAFAKAPELPKQEKVRIKGTVTTDGTNVVKAPFQVGVVEVVSGEFTQGNGSYYLELPKQSTYKVAFWKPNYEDLRVLELALEDDNTFTTAVWLPRQIVAKDAADNEPKDLRRAGREKRSRSQISFLNDDLKNTLNIFQETAAAASSME